MITVRVVLSYFSKDENHIYYTIGRLGHGQFYGHIDENFVFHELPGKDYGVKSTFDEMKSKNPSRFMLFQDNSSDNVYLMYCFHRHGINVELLQDGYKPYPIWHRKNLPLVLFKETLDLYMQMYRRHAVIPSLYLKSYKYGAIKFVDDLWLEYPDKLPNTTRKRIFQIPEFTDESLAMCLKIFDYKPDIQDNIILYVGQPLRTSSMQKVELDIINEIVARHTERQFIFRPHPLMTKEQKEEIVKIGGIKVYEKSIPIELLIVSLKGSIIVSPWSTALLTYNKDCRFYWIHRLLTKDKKILASMQMEVVNPTNFIIEVDSIDEIQ